MRLVFASNNKHKLEEVCQILPKNVQIISLQEVGFYAEIDETGNTLEENSAIKASTIWDWLTKNCLTGSVDGVFADDTGLEINALGGAPGVRTARWAGENACDITNRQKVLCELQGVQDRSARFRTVISIIMSGELQQVEGIVDGSIALDEQGEGGFGYDPIFIPKNHAQTFAMLPAEEKNAISHRGRAMEELKKIVENKL